MRARTVTSILWIAGAALGAAFVGLLGAYLVLPAVAPGVVPDDQSGEANAVARDSTAGRTSPSSTAEADTLDQSPMAQKESTPTREEEGDRAGEKEASKEEKPSTASSSTAPPNDASNGATLQALRDSIDTLRRRLQATKEAADTLRKEAAALREKVAAAEAEQAKVGKLSNALMDMRRRNLGNLLQNVDMSVLKKLYQQTSGRARTRLLQSMPPGQAAQFVNQVVENDSESPSNAAPDSVSSAK